MTAPRPAQDDDRLDRFRATVELVGAVAVTATKVVAAVGSIATILRRRTTRCP